MRKFVAFFVAFITTMAGIAVAPSAHAASFGSINAEVTGWEQNTERDTRIDLNSTPAPEAPVEETPADEPTAEPAPAEPTTEAPVPVETPAPRPVAPAQPEERDTVIEVAPKPEAPAPAPTTVVVEKVDTIGHEPTGSSLEDPAKCAATAGVVATPVVASLALGLISQVRIPGLEQVAGEINAEMARVNDEIQRGLGLHNEQLAELARTIGADRADIANAGLGLVGAIAVIGAIAGVATSCQPA